MGVHRSHRVGIGSRHDGTVRHRSITLGIVVALALLTGTISDVALDHAPVADAAPATRFEPLTPCRLVDTRDGRGVIPIDTTTIAFDARACGVPDGAAAIAITVTIVRPSSGGWLVAYPSGVSRPDAAILNWTPWVIRANSATVPIGADGRVLVHRSDGLGTGEILVDVSGAFVPASSATSGRFVAMAEARRLADTRRTGIVAAGGEVEIPLPDDLPDDVTAVALNVTALGNRTEGYVTPYPMGAARPTASALNLDAPTQFRAAATIVAVGDDGTGTRGLRVFSSTRAHLVVDMTGWFTGESAEESSDGLFVPVTPRRLRDTRLEVHPIHRGGTIEVTAGTDYVKGDHVGPPAAVSVNVTMIEADERGYLTVLPARTDLPSTSSGYAMRNELTAQFAMSATSAHGLGVYSEQGTDVTVDLLGWFTGEPVPSTSPEPAPNPVRPPRIIALGDSTMAGVERNYATDALRSGEWTFLPYSCRRLVRPSCQGIDGVYPPNTLQVLQSIPDTYDVLVIMGGYNDGGSTFPRDLQLIYQAARAKHIRRVVWLTHARELPSDRGGSIPGKYTYHVQNAHLREMGPLIPRLEVVEWVRLTRLHPEYTYVDGIHLDRPGGWAAADFMSRAVAWVTGQPCALPYSPGAPLADRCEHPDSVPPADVVGLYDF